MLTLSKIKQVISSFCQSYKEASCYQYDKRYYYKISEIDMDASNNIIIVLQVRGKRAARKLTLEQVLTTKNIINELHPFESCVIGVLSYSQEREALQLVNDIYKKFCSVGHCSTSVKFDSVIDFYEQVDMDSAEVYISANNNDGKQERLKFSNLMDDPKILCGLGSVKACYIGYKAAESILKKADK